MGGKTKITLVFGSPLLKAETIENPAKANYFGEKEDRVPIDFAIFGRYGRCFAPHRVSKSGWQERRVGKRPVKGLGEGQIAN